MQCRKLLDHIVRSLREADTSLERKCLVLVARSLATPRSSVDIDLVALDTDNRIVIIEKVCILDMLEPETAVSTLACTAATEEHIGCTVMGYN